MANKAVKERLLNDLGTWQADGKISWETAEVLRERWSAPGLGLGTVAKYLGVAGAFLAGAGVVGAGAAMTGSELFGALVTLAFAAGMLYGGLRLAADPRGTYQHSCKVVLLLGVVALNGGLGLLVHGLGVSEQALPIVLGLVSLPVTFALAYLHKNIFLIILGSLLFFHWVGSFSSMAGRSTYTLSIQDPRLMAAVALLGLAVGIYHERSLREATGRFYQAYQAVSLTYLNLSLLILAIYPTDTALAYIIVWAAAGIGQVVGGARLDNPLLVGFGVTALAINLYTRYFENFWKSMDAGLFLLLGGVVLFGVAAGLEGMLRRRGEPAGDGGVS